MMLLRAGGRSAVHRQASRFSFPKKNMAAIIDPEFTKQMQDWVQALPGQRDVKAGAELLLRLTRNEFLYRSACARPDKYDAIIEAELTKHLRIRLDGLTRQQVASMERTVTAAASESLAAGEPPAAATEEQPEATAAARRILSRGLRPDHDQLPNTVKVLVEENGRLFFKMKSVFEALKRMEDATPCDRYELLKQLKELDDRYRANWRVYDNAQPGAEYIIPGTKPAQTLDQQITAACKYLTYGRKRLPELDGRPDDALAIRTEMQKRIDFLTEVGHRFSRGVLISLQSLGFRTP